jgi:peptide/nickel transport system substrate-binding protein
MDSDADRIRDKDGVKLSFTLLTSDDPSMTRIAKEMADQWLAVGVEATTRSIGSDSALELVRSRDFDAALVQVELTADPDPYPLWHSTQAQSGQNFSGFANDAADIVMEEARLTADTEQRIELYHTFQATFVDEVPALLIYYPIYTYAVDAGVRDVQLTPLFHNSDRFRNIQDWYVETKEIVVTEKPPLDKTPE